MLIKLKGKVFNVSQTKGGPYAVGVLIASADGNSDAVTVFTNNSTYKAGMEYSGDVRIWLRVCSEPDVRFPKKNKEVD